MLDVLRRYVDSLTGITEMPRERAEKLVQELSKRGEIRARDLGKQAQELMERSARNRRELIRLVQKEIARQIHAVGLATRDDVAKLEDRIKTLERRPRTPKAKPRAKPKPTASRKTQGSQGI